MIYCVEDDSSIRDLMIYTLTIAGFNAKGFADSEAFWESMDGLLPELILLDIMLPGEDGITILKKLKSSAATAAVPVIMATAKGSEYDRVIGLDPEEASCLTATFTWTFQDTLSLWAAGRSR